MDRRAFVRTVGVGLTGFIAGCNSQTDSETTAQTTSTTTLSPTETPTVAPSGTETRTTTGTETPTETATQTPTRTPSQVGVLGESGTLIESDELVQGNPPYVEALVFNGRESAIGPTNVSVDWYNDNGDYMSNDTVGMIALNGGEIWRALIGYGGFRPDEVSDYEIYGTFQRNLAQSPSRANLIESDMETPGRGVRITGRVENGYNSSLSLQAHAKIYSSGGDVIAYATDSDDSIPAGETWAFFISLEGGFESDPGDHEIILTGL